MKQTIIDAINNNQVLTFTYSGIPRVVEPHAVGLSRTGKEVLRCFQTYGGHVTPGHEWDLCELNKIYDLEISGATFHASRPGYRRGDSHMTDIFAEL
ncbi:hypothetical protein PSH79_20750 [Pseudomonas sp. FP2196]|uniref:hypothetical protein n=1 Tax=Pseudomonas sp. FP2196 TaxID=2954086 RepID=UPI0027355E87|nr:hypothetical protein [Pseudomonas sp. FP2196]WLH34339.1 hypothetical protein PSH79_20750 [Pseudomonas sp. FP2196]